MGLSDDFEATAVRAKMLNKTLSNDELKVLYSLYKQATIGDVNVDKPGLLDLKGRAKWDAWNDKKGMAKEEAMKKYMEFAKQLGDKHGYQA